ncbi:hypothetical protein [Parafilimonas sp.]|uniref:hypothetical protein n=1 Tax=Parafilimonas sp. TaxID=1969739 RepID=UPI0039E6171E
MKRLLLFNLFVVVVAFITHAQVTNNFPATGTPIIGGSNYMSIGNRLFFQAKNQTDNGNNRGIVANNLYWDSAQSKWTNGTSASFDFALMRFEAGGDIGFFNGPSPNPSARQTFTNDELESYRTVTIKNSGKIGIGTANPAEKLSVKGTVLAQKVKVSQAAADWPDYVFDKDYPLMPLDSVEAFIQKNGHLPEIAPAAEIKSAGVDLGDNQTKLLQKIEELTLYLIEQNKVITELKKQLQQQKQEICKLQSGLESKD